MLAAVGYAFYRRLVQKPARLERNREALLILSLIAAIMITDFLFDGFRFALVRGQATAASHTKRATPSSARGRARRSPARPACAHVGYHLSYWLQMATVFAFLVLLPVGEHFPYRHRVAGAVFCEGAARRTACPLSISTRRWKAPTAMTWQSACAPRRDLLWKDALDAFTCTECGRCKDACPTFLTGKPLALKWVFDSLKGHLLEQREPSSAATPIAAGARSCGHQRGHALGVHDLRVLRSRLSDRARASAQVLSPAPAAGDDGGHVPARAKGGVRRLRSAEQSMGSAGRHARRLGARARSAGCHDRRGSAEDSTGCSTSARRSRSIRAGRRLRALSSRVMRAARRPHRYPRRRRDLDRRMRAPRRQRDAVPVACEESGRDAEWSGRHPDRHLRSARVQHPDERVPGVRRPLRSNPSHAADRAADRARAG